VRTETDHVRAALVAAADALARRLGVDDADRLGLAGIVPLLGPWSGRASDRVDDEGEAPDPGRLGRLHQAMLGDEHRHRNGVHYTPAPTAVALVALALDGLEGAVAGEGPRVCDPSCGGGVFLLAVADRLVAAGASPADALSTLAGIDLDPLAVEVTRAALVLWGAMRGLHGDELVAVARQVARSVVVGDALAERWPGEGSLAAVVGNPPFGGQLARSTARDRAGSDAARALLGGSAAGYADTAGLFLVRAVAASAPGARVVLVQPLSFLGARDAGAVRRRLTDHAVLESVWLAGERLFGASVDVCAPVLRVAGPLAVPDVGAAVVIRRGGEVEVVAEVATERLDRAGSWAPVVAAATGVPAVDLSGREVLGAWARATAGFRDEFYALAPFVVDRPDLASRSDRPGLAPMPEGSARLITAGLVEPAHVVWGRRTTRLAGQRLTAPVVRLGALRAWAEGPDGDRRLAAWADARLRPKVVVATQTRVVEAALDDDGDWWPSVPVVSVVLDAEHDDTHHRLLALAALTAPPVSAWAAERSGGTALTPQALKLSAKQVLEVPLPVDRDLWEQGAAELALVAATVEAAARRHHLLEAGRLLTAAHRLPPDEAEAVLTWWADRAGALR
jgi:predicted RNA methylase